MTARTPDPALVGLRVADPGARDPVADLCDALRDRTTLAWMLAHADVTTDPVHVAWGASVSPEAMPALLAALGREDDFVRAMRAVRRTCLAFRPRIGIASGCPLATQPWGGRCDACAASIREADIAPPTLRDVLAVIERPVPAEHA